MNDYLYLPRASSALIEQALGVSAVVALTGARQTGKSTLTRSEPFLADRPYFTLDNLDVRDRAVSAPHEFVRSAPSMTIDEVQRAPDLILAIKGAVDEDRPRIPGRFVLTGSANLLLMRRVSETLAGRATYVALWPLTRREKLGLGRTGIWTELAESPAEGWYDIVRTQDVPPGDWRQEVHRSGYPEPFRLPSDAARALWFEGYVRTYLERDLQDLASIESLLDFWRLMRAACLRLGNLLNQAELGRDTRISRSTVHRYLNLLETSYQLVRLEPYSVNRTKRLIKTPKLYWSDSGLALHLGGGDLTGAHFENVILGDLLAWRDLQIPRPEVLYWRTATNQEVDLVIELPTGLIAIEVKATTHPGPRDVQQLRVFRDEYSDVFLGGLLLHDGAETSWISERILSAPWWRVV